jgi:hypothetical protein
MTAWLCEGRLWCGGARPPTIDLAMSRRVAAVIVLALLAGTGPAAHASARARPALRLMALSPLRVHGSGFVRDETVRVRLRANGRRSAVRHVRATRRGGFTAKFGRVLIDRCSSFTITAVGRSGRKATLHRARPECPPA